MEVRKGAHLVMHHMSLEQKLSQQALELRVLRVLPPFLKIDC